VHCSHVFNLVVFVDYDRHMVGEARREKRQEKNRKHGKALKSHKHIQSSFVVI
jgi:hypothetical protein